MAIIIFGVLMAITLVFSEPAQSNDNTITIKCSNTVDRGVIILDSTPIMNCKDMELIQMFVGSSLSLGPIPNMGALAEQLEALVKKEPKTDPEEVFEQRKEKAFEEI
jgi:hypothetical protein